MTFALGPWGSGVSYNSCLRVVGLHGPFRHPQHPFPPPYCASCNKQAVQTTPANYWTTQTFDIVQPPVRPPVRASNCHVLGPRSGGTTGTALGQGLGLYICICSLPINEYIRGIRCHMYPTQLLSRGLQSN